MTGRSSLCGGTVVFMASFGMLLPELPAHLAAMGGGYLGGVVGMFTLAAFYPLRVAESQTGLAVESHARRLCHDRLGRVRISGGHIMQLFSPCGFSWAFDRVASSRTSAMLTTGSKSRRGEALGYLGVAGNAGMALGPAFGSWLTVEHGIEWMFIASALLGMVSVGLTWPLEETLPGARPVQASDLNPFQGGLIDPQAWPAALVLLPVAYAFGVYLTITPDFVDHLGYVYKGSFNTIIVASSISMRLFAGRLSDRHGRVPVLLVGTALMAVGMAVLGSATTKSVATLGALLYGASIGINMPTVFAWTADLAQPGKVALALGTMLMALEVGIGGGAVYSGSAFNGDVANIPMLYYSASLGTAITALALIPPTLNGRKV